MNSKKRILFVLVFLISVSFAASSFSQSPPSSQTAGGISRQQMELEKKKKLQERITKPRVKPKEAAPEEIIPKEAGPKILIEKIKVEGATLISEEDIKKITSQFEGKELSLSDMQKAADLITDEYRKKGYITCRAYIPPQTIKDAVLIIRIIEGKLGKLRIEGNRYFKTSLLKKKICLKPGEPFDYSKLQKSLTYINEHPDRTAKAVLIPGKEPGTTDIVLQVQDNFPFHIGFEYDNFGSRYIEKDRYALTLEHNNLLGFDDKLYLKYQRAQDGLYELRNLRYSVPLSPDLEVGFYYLWSKSKLGKEYKDLDIRGKSQLGGLFLTRSLIKEDNIDLELNLGFDYKHIRNYTSEVLTSRDELRIFKTGFDLDTLDKWGRTILTAELDLGIPEIFGGVQAKDPMATREGAGGKFLKFAGNLYRLQPMPFSSSILWKNQFQFSNYTLPSCEQFQIGGIANVRGYPSAEYSGDKGYAASIEWSFPLYFLPGQIKVPLSKSSFYDATRIVFFYDWGYTQLNKELAGEQKCRTLKGWGFGLRFNLPEDLSARIECAYPIGQTPSDGNHLHTYVSVSKKF